MSNDGDLPDRSIGTLGAVLAFHAAHAPGAPALVFEGRTTTYGELSARAQALAAELRAEGFRPGERISYLGKNTDAYFVALYAAALLGLVLTPLNWRLAEDEWAFILEDSGARLLYADDIFWSAAEALAARSPAVELRALPRMDGPAPQAQAFESAAAPDDVVMQIYTSGTTGRPKGAMLTHRNMLALRVPGYEAGLYWFPRRMDASLLVLPIAHIAGTAYALFGLYGGGRVVISVDFDPPAVLETIEREKVSHILLAPAAMRLLLEQPTLATRDLSSLRFMTYGASPIPQALLERALAGFGCGFVQMYGMTEAAGGVVALSPEDHLADDEERLRSAGRAMPGVEIVVVGPGGEPLPAGELGEILVRSEAVMPGYWRKPDESAETLAGGWLRTGDIGRLDARGYLYVLDRAKDMIISGGENIYPAEVENALFGHPDVADVAVIGVPSEKWGEEPLAVIVPKAGREPDPESLTAWARARIAGFKTPKRYAFVEALPRNAGNKVLRRELRAMFAQAADQPGS
jgi:long-chain acyl-CoA synthetase